MQISITASLGEGKTLLSSFDNALQNAGVSNYNLIPLSSIIPPNSNVFKIASYKTPPEEFGHRLYVVKAERRSNETGKYVAAGIGWYQLKDKRGFFVEHSVQGESKKAVKTELQLLIKNSLKEMCKFRNIKFQDSELKSAISITYVKNKPACALVLAIYKSEPWA